MDSCISSYNLVATNDAAAYLANRIMRQRTKIVGVCGASCSGKSTFANELQQKCGEGQSMVLAADSYWRYPRAEMFRLGLTGYDWESRDRNRLIRDLTRHRAGRPIDEPVFDYARERPTQRPYIVSRVTL